MRETNESRQRENWPLTNYLVLGAVIALLLVVGLSVKSRQDRQIEEEKRSFAWYAEWYERNADEVYSLCKKEVVTRLGISASSAAFAELGAESDDCRPFGDETMAKMGYPYYHFSSWVEYPDASRNRIRMKWEAKVSGRRRAEPSDSETALDYNWDFEDISIHFAE